MRGRELNNNENRAQKSAENFRAEHGLEDAPIKDMFELVHTATGIDVLSINVPGTEHGLSMTARSPCRLLRWTMSGRRTRRPVDPKDSP